MSQAIAADPTVIEGLRQRLLSFQDRQVAALDAVLAELVRTQIELEHAKIEAQREVWRCQAALDACIAAAAAAAAAGSYVDCSGPRWALEEAEHRLRVVVDTIAEVQSAGDRYREQDRAHRSYLSSAIPSMRAGLEARAVSLEHYLAWRVSAGDSSPDIGSLSPANALRAIADELAAKNRDHSTKLPMPAERKEGNRGGPERAG